MNKKIVAVFFGGQSSEHPISVKSAATIIRGLAANEDFELVLVGITKAGKWLLVDSAASLADGSWEKSETNAYLLPDATEKCLLLCGRDGSVKRQPVDVAFPALHGRFGEDGSIQGLFELAGIPYVGCGIAASAVSMDKLYTKAMVERTGVEQAKYVGFEKRELADEAACIQKVESAFPYPVFVKPTDGGSSQGVSKVNAREELMEALKLAASEGTRVMVEENISGREVECAVMSSPEGVLAAGVGEIMAADTFYSFDAKYSNPESQTTTSPLLPEGKKEEIMEAARTVFSAVGGHGLSRVDFFLENGTNRVIFNEINTLPGFTAISMYPQLWQAAGLELPELTRALVESAYTRRS